METIRKPVVIIAAFILVGLLTFGCSSEEESAITGTVTGVITAANGVTPVPGATVGLASPLANGKIAGFEKRKLETILDQGFIIDPDGPTTTTDGQGRFTLEGVPTGTVTLGAKAGAFEAMFTVEVSENEIVDSGSVGVDAIRKLGHVTGSFDSIQNIVASLGSETERILAANLSNPELLAEYDIIFMNCGSGTYNEERAQVLRQYVEAGGTLYVSDLDYRYVEAIFPGDVEFGSGGSQTIEAQIQSQLLQQYVQSSTLDITYNLGGWIRVTGVSGGGSSDVLLRGQPNEIESGTEPLAFTFTRGNGRVIFTTFHNSASASEDQIQVLSYYIFLP